MGGLLRGASAGLALSNITRRPGLDQRIPYAVCGVLSTALVVGDIVFAGSYTPT